MQGQEQEQDKWVVRRQEFSRMPDGLHRAYLVLRVQQQSLALGLPDVTRKEGLGAGEEHALDIS